MRVSGRRAWLALAMTCLVGCSASPCRRGPTLATVTAPEPGFVLTREHFAGRARASERLGFERVLSQLQPMPAEGWQLSGLRVGRPASEQAIRPDTLQTGISTEAGPWPDRWRQLTFAWKERQPGDPPEPLPRQRQDGTTLDGVLIELELTYRFEGEERPDVVALDCAGHDEWLSTRQVRFERHPPTEGSGCEWWGRSGDNTVALRLTKRQIHLFLVWQVERYRELAEEAERVAREKAGR